MKPTMQHRIWAIIQAQPTTAIQISKAHRIPYDTVRSCVRNLHLWGHIEFVEQVGKENRYRATAKAPREFRNVTEPAKHRYVPKVGIGSGGCALQQYWTGVRE